VHPSALWATRSVLSGDGATVLEVAHTNLRQLACNDPTVRPDPYAELGVCSSERVPGAAGRTWLRPAALAA
jgi:hypothetical protein